MKTFLRRTVIVAVILFALILTEEIIATQLNEREFYRTLTPELVELAKDYWPGPVEIPAGWGVDGKGEAVSVPAAKGRGGAE